MSLNRRRAPSHLKPDGAKLWRDLSTEYSIGDAAGLALVERAAECMDRLRSAQAAIVAHGEVVLDRYGAPKLNPACGLEKDARNGLFAALKALNLDLEPLRDAVGRPPGR